jgi:hypothetical protein
MIHDYVLALLTLAVSKTKREEWIFTFLDKIGRGVQQFKLKWKSDKTSWYSKSHFENDAVYNSLYLDQKIKDTRDELESIQDEQCKHYKKEWLHILEYLKADNESTRQWINELFPTKNKTLVVDSDWLVKFSDYCEADQFEFFSGIETEKPIKIKSYLFFIESIDSLFKAKVNPFDRQNQQSFILVTTFENMLIKICAYSNITVTKQEIEKTKFKVLAKLI